MRLEANAQTMSEGSLSARLLPYTPVARCGVAYSSSRQRSLQAGGRGGEGREEGWEWAAPHQAALNGRYAGELVQNVQRAVQHLHVDKVQPLQRRERRRHQLQGLPRAPPSSHQTSSAKGEAMMPAESEAAAGSMRED